MPFLIHKTDDFLVFATAESSNRKTGPSTQIWIMDSKNHPVQSRRNGFDAKNQCKGCRLASGNGCYVNELPLMRIWRSYINGDVKFTEKGSPEWSRLFYNQFVRFGAYGNPSLLPLSLIKDIVNVARKTTGYFHDWHLMSPKKARDYGQYLMASCEPDNYLAAQKLGLRTFTISEEPISGSLECPYSTKGITCIECSLCDGNAKGKQINLWIRSHGYQINKAKAVLAS